MIGQERSEDVRRGQERQRSGRTGQDMSGQIRRGDERSGQIRKGWVNTSSNGQETCSWEMSSKLRSVMAEAVLGSEGRY